MTDIMVSLDEVCAYLTNVASNHTTRTTRAMHGPAGQSHEQVAFVLRRCVEELKAQFTGGRKIKDRAERSANEVDIAPNQTYRNRATT